jgi:hypothetical protein
VSKRVSVVGRRFRCGALADLALDYTDGENVVGGRKPDSSIRSAEAELSDPAIAVRDLRWIIPSPRLAANFLDT